MHFGAAKLAARQRPAAAVSQYPRQGLVAAGAASAAHRSIARANQTEALVSARTARIKHLILKITPYGYGVGRFYKSETQHNVNILGGTISAVKRRSLHGRCGLPLAGIGSSARRPHFASIHLTGFDSPMPVSACKFRPGAAAAEAS